METNRVGTKLCRNEIAGTKVQRTKLLLNKNQDCTCSNFFPITSFAYISFVELFFQFRSTPFRLTNICFFESPTPPFSFRTYFVSFPQSFPISFPHAFSISFPTSGEWARQQAAQGPRGRPWGAQGTNQTRNEGQNEGRPRAAQGAAQEPPKEPPKGAPREQTKLGTRTNLRW